jgi:hypothetical protein
MKIVTLQNNVKFPFEKYCNSFLSLVPPSDLIGIGEIRFVEKFMCFGDGPNAVNLTDIPRPFCFLRFPAESSKKELRWLL